MSLLLSGLWNNAVKLGLPVVALACLALQGGASTSRVLAASAGVGGLVAACAVMVLLLRSEDAPLFAGAKDSLRYLVLDEFHTYDGAQGTDVAMLLRRLGMTLGTTGDGRPLGAITPVATSATLGGGAEGGPKLREFARTVFGVEFDEAPVLAREAMRQTRLLVNNPCEISESDAQRLYEAAW